MNAAIEFLDRHRERIGPEGVGEGERIPFSCLAATPRFRASAHVVFFLFRTGSPDPLYVLKVARGGGSAAGALIREAASLRAVQAARSGGFDSIPRLLVFEPRDDSAYLLETALPGRVMTARAVRSRPEACVEAVFRWICELHGATARTSDAPLAERARLLDTPLRRFEAGMGRQAPKELLSRTREILRPLGDAGWPLVFEHGDLGAPNILGAPEGGVGVVDWELAEPRGLPAQDLVFFLSFVAVARRGAKGVGSCVAAFHEAFFERDAWAAPYLARYAAAVRLPPELLSTLLVASCARYAAGLWDRLSRLTPYAEAPSAARWLAGNRHVALWDHAVRHFAELEVTRAPAGASARSTPNPIPKEV